jgi:acyl-CoA synthetase (AMP-forming)/AMP-acid ligase II
MWRRFAVIMVVLSLSLGAIAGEVIDRIVATVNKRPLLQSDWEDELHFEAFLQGRPVSSLTDAERSSALDRLVDQELLRQQMQTDFSLDEKQLDDRLKQVRAQTPGGATEQGWHTVLASYSMDEAQLRSKLAMQMQLLRFIDLRLRPNARIDRETIAEYYRDTLVPQVKAKGADPEPLEAVSGKIRELLSQQRMDELLTSWLQNLRGQSRIQMMMARGSRVVDLTSGTTK